MFNAGRLVDLGSVTADDEVQALPDHRNSRKKRDAVAKDLHLVVAALATDRSVLSCDAAVRKLLIGLIHACDRLDGIVWIDPSRRVKVAIRWLEDGAKPERRFQLGARTRP
jgi:hypothetical protein